MVDSIQRFQVVSELGAGEQGMMYRALDPRLQREVAIKSSTRASSPDLLDEARVMARLSHPNVVPVFEVGLEAGALFVVMEHIEGWDLGAWLRAPRALADVLHVLAQAGRGLAAAHERGILHRDFKPENVLVGRDGRVRISDFGLSQAARPASPASDVFAFATVVNEAVGERAITARLRSAIARGLAIDPDVRCPLDVLLAALEPRRYSATVKRWVCIVAAMAVLFSALAITGQARAGRSSACDASLAYAYPWQVSLRAAVTQPILDRKDVAITRAATATCRAEKRGELTQAQATVQHACLARRRFELTSVVEQTLARGALGERALRIADVERCFDLAGPALPIDPGHSRSLYARWVATWGDAEADREIAALEQQSWLDNDRELAVRIALDLAQRMIVRERLDLGEAAAQRAYRTAMDVRALELAASALTERSRVASLRGDADSAASFAQLAKELLDSYQAARGTRPLMVATTGE